MKELAELERRINHALDRIARGIEAVPATAGGGAAESGNEDLTALQAALAAEKARTAQLAEKLRNAPREPGGNAAQMQRKVEKLTGQLDVQGLELQRLKKTNAQLTETLRALRQAAESGVTDASAINRALQAEVEALRTARMAEIAEMDEILSELKPLIGEAADA
jgi:predicted  nucleic acid-binding Zn-ribbon protein